MTNRHLCVTKILFLSKIGSFYNLTFVKIPWGREKISQFFFQNIGEEKKQYVNSRSQKKCEFATRVVAFLRKK